MAYQMAATAVIFSDLEGHSPCSCRPFRMQFVEHLCNILHDANWQCARTVPLH